MKLAVRNPPYKVEIGRGLAIEPEARPAALLFDRAVAPFARKVAEAAGIPHLRGIEGGEGAKTLAVYGELLSWLASLELPRDAVLYVVGGGTLTDLGGFLAATYLRGVRYRSFPTTTLAIVDASVGGKTGINLPEGKNLAGAFHAPEAVLADLETLATLPGPVFKEGLVEAFKHGLIAGDEALLAPFDLHAGHPELEDYLARAVAVKIRVVEADYKERGERRLLNLGHTLAHALEAASGHRIPHGAAVAYGLLFAALLGRALGGEDLVPRVRELLAWLEPPPLPPLAFEELEPFLARDKKARAEGLYWVVPRGLGDLVVAPLPRRMLEETYARFWEAL